MPTLKPENHQKNRLNLRRNLVSFPVNLPAENDNSSESPLHNNPWPNGNRPGNSASSNSKS